MRAIIIGAKGYLGKHLYAYLMELGWEVKGYDIGLQNSDTKFGIDSLDVRNAEEFNSLNTQVDYIFYFSGITGTLNAYNDYKKYIDVNEVGLLHLLNKLHKEKSSARLVFPSTRLVYKGVKNVPLKEEDEKEFKTIYSLNKWFAEKLLAQYADYFNINYTVFRIGVPYGSFVDENYSYGTISFFLRKAQAGENIIVYGDGSQKRTFTNIRALVIQLAGTIMKSDSINQVYNISGETLSINEVANLIARKYNVSVVNTVWPELDKKVESGDTIFDSQKILGVLDSKVDSNFNDWLNKI